MSKKSKAFSILIFALITTLLAPPTILRGRPIAALYIGDDDCSLTILDSMGIAAYYNFVRIHQTLRISPAMAAGVTTHLWEISEIVDLLEKKQQLS